MGLHKNTLLTVNKIKNKFPVALLFLQQTVSSFISQKIITL